MVIPEKGRGEQEERTVGVQELRRKQGSRVVRGSLYSDSLYRDALP